MRTLEEIYGRCVLDEITGCRIWKGSMSSYGPRISAPDYTNGGKMTNQNGRRAVWHVATGKPLPSGWSAFGTCGNMECVELSHIKACSVADRGADVAKSGKQKGLTTRIVANRKIGKKRAKVTPELYQEIISSTETGVEIHKRTGISTQVISRIRTGQFTSYAPVGGIFSGLIR